MFGSRDNVDLFPAAIDPVRRRAAVVTHTYPLERTAEAMTFAMNEPHLAEKVVITVGGAEVPVR